MKKIALLSEEEVHDLISDGMREALQSMGLMNVKNPHQHKEILSAVEVAEMLNTTTAALATMRYRKMGIPYAKHGRKVYYKYDDVINYLQNHKVKLVG